MMTKVTKIKPLEIMTPEHPRWGEFIKRLEGPEGCNLRKDKKRGYIWNCRNDKSSTKKILKNMGDVDIKASLEYFDEQNACCDCEIMLNLDV